MLPPAEPTGTETVPLKKGTRQTEQRKAVYEALMSRTDHPSAVEVFLRVKSRVPSISLATVYNCLENLAASGQVRMVNHEREPSRYCANLGEHAHLFCSQCGSVTDLPVHTPVPPDQIWDLPEGITISQQEVSFRGICSQCSGTPQAPPRVLAPQSAPPSKPSSSPLAPARRLVP